MTEDITNRQAVWDLFADGGAVTILDTQETGVALNTARGYFSEWKRIGAIAYSHTHNRARFYVRAVDEKIAPQEQTVSAFQEGGPPLREIAWQVFREREVLTVADLVDAGVPRKSAEDFIAGWLADGAIRFDHREGKRKFFRIVSDAESAPPVKRRDNKLAPKDRRARKIWTAARHLKTFTARDLAAHATTSDVAIDLDEAGRYVRMLLRAGYLRVTRKARPADEIEARYRLIRDTGPIPPVDRRVRAVWDENEGCYTHLPEGAQ